MERALGLHDEVAYPHGERVPAPGHGPGATIRALVVRVARGRRRGDVFFADCFEPDASVARSLDALAAMLAVGYGAPGDGVFDGPTRGDRRPMPPAW